MITTIAVAAWIGCVILIWGLQAGFQYELGKQFPRLGTAKEQWEEDGRRKAIVMTIILTFIAPIGLFASIMSALTVGYGLKFKFSWEG